MGASITQRANASSERPKNWRHRAECRWEDPELFFPVGTSGPALIQIAEAKTVCRRCPVNTECLNWALGSGQDSGVWGGMSEDERRAVKRRNAKRKQRAAAEYDELTVQYLTAGQHMRGATAHDIAEAVVRLHAAGCTSRVQIAERIGSTPKAVDGILERIRKGLKPVGDSGLHAGKQVAV